MSTVEELADEAQRRQLYATALTDHDTVAGQAAFLRYLGERGIKGITGVEISTDYRYGRAEYEIARVHYLAAHLLLSDIDVRCDRHPDMDATRHRVGTGRTVHLTGRAVAQATGTSLPQPERSITLSIEEVRLSWPAVGTWVDDGPSRYTPDA